MQVMYHFCSKNTIPSRYRHIQPFRLNYTKVLIKKNNTFRVFIDAKSSVIWSKQAFTVLSLSIHIKAISHNLPWLVLNQWGPWYERNSFSLLKDRSKLAVNTVNCHHQHYLKNAIWKMSGGLQDVIILSYTTWN